MGPRLAWAMGKAAIVLPFRYAEGPQAQGAARGCPRRHPPLTYPQGPAVAACLTHDTRKEANSMSCSSNSMGQRGTEPASPERSASLLAAHMMGTRKYSSSWLRGAGWPDKGAGQICMRLGSRLHKAGLQDQAADHRTPGRSQAVLLHPGRPYRKPGKGLWGSDPSLRLTKSGLNTSCEL